jgi:hypothetical protein
VGTKNRHYPTIPDIRNVPKKSKHNWQAIRAEYVEAPSEDSRPTLEALAAKYGVSGSYLREKASTEKWKDEADKYLASVSTVRQTQKAEVVGTEQAQWDKQCYEMSKGLLMLLHNQLKGALPKDGKPGSKALDVKEIETLTKALERVHNIGKAALGDAPDESAIAADPSQYSQMSAQELAALYAVRTKKPGARES